MRRNILTLILLTFFATTGTAQQNYTMYESVYLKPKNGHTTELTESMNAHNKKFHPDGPHTAQVQFVSAGNRSGAFVWLMGPCTFTDLDNRPAGDDHANDWDNNVMIHVEKTSDVEYWRRLDDLSYYPENYELPGKLHIRSWDVKSGKEEEFMELMKQVVEVFSTKKYTGHWSFWVNYFSSDGDWDMAGLMGFEDYAFFDIQSPFVKDYEEINGEGSFAGFMGKLNTLTNSFSQEIRELNVE